MIVLLHHLWPGLAMAGLLGLGFSLLFGAGASAPSARPAAWAGAAVLLVGAGLAAGLQLVPGRPGLWLDIVVLCGLAYAAGSLLGLLGRRLLARDRAS